MENCDLVSYPQQSEAGAMSRLMEDPGTIQNTNSLCYGIMSDGVHSFFQDPIEQAVIFFDDTFKCPFLPCSKTFSSARSFRLHRVKFHKLPPYSCIVCSSPFESYFLLCSHMEKENHLIHCIMCPQVFKRTSEASNHYGQKHRTFLCLHCALPLKGKIMYKNHLAAAHFDEETEYPSVSSFVETAMNTSFTESVPTPISDCPEEPEVLEENVGGEAGSSSVSHEDRQRFIDATGFSDCTEMNENLNLGPVDSVTNCVLSGAGSAGTDSVAQPSTATLSVRLLQNPFYGCNPPNSILFGAGADEFLEDSSDVLTSCNPASSNHDDTNQWIGHSVEIFQNLSEKYKQTFQYTCTECARSFKSWKIFRRHTRTHEFKCKHCSLHFSSLPEYESHKKQHSVVRSNFLCSVCNQYLDGLKNLMVHELRHRLNSAYRNKLEEEVSLKKDINVIKNLKEQSNAYECRVCQAQIRDFSYWMRHEIWHNWNFVWTSYVIGRIFKGTFTQAESQKLQKEVVLELKKKWRDCSKKHENSRQTLAPPETLESMDESSYEDASTAEELSLCESDTESEFSEFSEEGVNQAVNGWMSYWYSYIGLDEFVPPWIVPVLKELRSKWKNYHTDEHDQLYRKMDQISTLVHAQKGGLTPEWPRVIIQKLPSNIAVHDKIQLDELFVEMRTRFNNIDHSVNTDVKVMGNDGCIRKRKRTKPPETLILSNGSSSELPVCSHSVEQTKNSIVHSNPIAVKENAFLQLPQPVVKLEKLSWPIQKPKNQSADCPAISESRRTSTRFSMRMLASQPSSASSNSWSADVSSQMKWLKDEIGRSHIPTWALHLVERVCRNSILSPANKLEKMFQIRNLLRAQLGQQMISDPYVNLIRIPVNIFVTPKNSKI